MAEKEEAKLPCSPSSRYSKAPGGSRQRHSRGGERLYKEVIRLVQMQPETLTRGKWQGWVMRMRRLLRDLAKRSDALGTLASRLNDTFESLSTFLRIRGVDRTNNKSERTLRPAVTRRKTSFGCTSEQGQRWMERALSVMMTCRLHRWSFASILRDNVRHTLAGTQPDISQFDDLKKIARAERRLLGLA